MRYFTRDHPDEHGGGWPPLVLDRQRVIQSAAFRRLQYKTQVFLSLEGDHFRTRLTHTLEVAHLARCIAMSARSADLPAELGALDEQLAEVVALAHDLGHSAFGHAGERALDECMAGHGGFNHNAHSLRVVEYLEHPYPQFRGLNLTRVVRECLAKHETRYDAAGAHPLNDGTPAPLEGQAAAMADRLAYTLHDLQDGLFAGLLTPEDLRPLEIWRAAGAVAAITDEGEQGRHEGPEARRHEGEGTGNRGQGKEQRRDEGSWLAAVRPAVDRVQMWLLRRVGRCEGGNVGREESRIAADAPDRGTLPPSPLPTFSRLRLQPGADSALAELESLLRDRVYRNQQIVEADRNAARVVRELFAVFIQNPARLPTRFARRVEEQGAHRVVADYIAGMTDRFALNEHARLASG